MCGAGLKARRVRLPPSSNDDQGAMPVTTRRRRRRRKVNQYRLAIRDLHHRPAAGRAGAARHPRAPVPRARERSGDEGCRTTPALWRRAASQILEIARLENVRHAVPDVLCQAGFEIAFQQAREIVRRLIDVLGGGQDFLRRELAVLDDGVQLVGDTGRRRRKRADQSGRCDPASRG